MSRAAKMPLAYSYRRWSSPEQSKGDTLRRQTAAAASWCERNKAVLDTTLRMTDVGSAFRGGNLADPDVHALAEFVSAVRSGRVPRGSLLIVESFDRLSRDKCRLALPPILELVNAGIRIVQLVPEQVVDESSDDWAIMGLIMTLSRGHNESLTKSNRVGAAWKNKQKNAATKVVTKKLPGWVRYVDGKLVLDPGRKAAVEQVYQLSAGGLGVSAIAQRLNAEGVKTFGRSARWNDTVVYHLLRSRAVIGEYQPCQGRGSTRKPVGDPVKGYFPPAVSEGLWQSVQGGLRSRRSFRGARGRHVNLFSGLLKDARDGGSLTTKHQRGRPSTLIPVGAKQGTGAVWSSFNASVFERAILTKLVEVKASDVLPESDANRRVEELSSQLEECEVLIKTWRAKMDDVTIVDIVSAKLSELETRRRLLAEQVADAQREAASPLAEAWGQFRSAGSLLIDQAADDDLRLRVRTAIRRVVESIWVCLLGRGRAGRFRMAYVEVRFKGGAARSYVIEHRAAASKTDPGWWSVESHRHPDGLSLSMSDPSWAGLVLPTLERLLDAVMHGPARARGQGEVGEAASSSRRPGD